MDMSGTTDDTALSAFFNSHIHITDNAMVVPEVGYFDGKEDGFGEAQGSAEYVGAKWQIDF
ncbi:MAG: hypothetical protein ABFS43_11550 [Thermodesulfobacteriota bacterium]